MCQSQYFDRTKIIHFFLFCFFCFCLKKKCQQKTLKVKNGIIVILILYQYSYYRFKEFRYLLYTTYGFIQCHIHHLCDIFSPIVICQKKKKKKVKPKTKKPISFSSRPLSSCKSFIVLIYSFISPLQLLMRYPIQSKRHSIQFSISTSPLPLLPPPATTLEKHYDITL